ncbi:hypothetical protein SEMRO_220_G090800.1 [Seminavis robusta]|uniref:Uncharacterized protein n=1 Tax=Seminavis robusta TaxID=568900 RepID=A0A9N8DLA6_9STRA|nr:hypothetical protein SEMRO_220_G090800.1 [Seminavis robusta]|eukprot:Sro220_g090800.1 n/a (139) ;mRNA; f:68746-69162
MTAQWKKSPHQLALLSTVEGKLNPSWPTAKPWLIFSTVCGSSTEISGIVQEDEEEGTNNGTNNEADEDVVEEDLEAEVEFIGSRLDRSVNLQDSDTSSDYSAAVGFSQEPFAVASIVPVVPARNSRRIALRRSQRQRK